MPRNMRGTLTSSNSDSVHTSVSVIVLYKSCTLAIPIYLGPSHLEKLHSHYHLCFLLYRTDFLLYNTTVKLLPLLILIAGSYLSLRILLRCSGVLTSLVSAVARKFMQGRYPD